MRFLGGLVLSAFALTAGGAVITIPPGVPFPEPPATMRIFRLKKARKIAGKIANALDTSVISVRENDGPDVAFFRPYGPVPPSIPSPQVVAKQFFTGRLPDDPEGMQFVASPPFPLMRQIVRKNQTPSDPEEVSTLVRMDRFVDGLRVFGAGSLAVAEVRGESVIGAVVRWDRAVLQGTRPTIALTRQRIRQRFQARYPSFTGVAELVTDSAELVYVGDRQFLEPAYRVLFRIHRPPLPDGTVVPEDHGVLYVPATVPMPRADVPVDVSNPSTCANQVGAVQGMPLDLYAMFEFSFDWAGSARGFRKPMTANTGYTGRRFCYLEPRMLYADKNLFVNSVPIAHIETHGTPGFLFTAADEGVKLAEAGGYGGDEQGMLQLLVLHSCEVVASHDDNEFWYDTWFAIFHGLHTVVGYRTKALMDGVPAAFGQHVASKRPILRSWIAEVTLVPEYGQGGTVSSTGGAKPLGRPAAITVCDHDADTIEGLANLSSPQCLVSYWLKN